MAREGPTRSSLLGIAAVVVDLGSWQVEASEAQQAADAAALAGVVRLPDGIAAARERALEVAADNGFDHDNDSNVNVLVQEYGDETGGRSATWAISAATARRGRCSCSATRCASCPTRRPPPRRPSPVPDA